MGLLERLENLIQGAVEGSTSSVLRQKLKPVEIENQLERSMRDNTQPSSGTRLAPNNYTVFLNPDSFRETIVGSEGYNRHCEMLLNQFATQQGYTLLHPRISVAFDTDSSLGRRDVRVEAIFDTPPQQPMRNRAAPQNVHTHTQVIQQAPVQATQRETSNWSLRVIRGKDSNKTYPIPLGEVLIGRAHESDIVLEDDRNTVSRQHAVLINHGSELRLRDSGSKNGTKVNGNYVPQHAETLVTNGSEIVFGECVVRIQQNQGGW